MDISKIQAENTNVDTGLKLGTDKAPVKIIEFMNLRCPYCRRWFEESDDLLQQYVAEEKLQRVIKLFNKEKPGLKRGNVMHGFVPYTDEEAAHAALLDIYHTQEHWGHLEMEEVADFAKKELHLQPQDNQQVEQAVIEEAAKANVQFVPTIILGEHIFDENITVDELKVLLDQALNA